MTSAHRKPSEEALINKFIPGIIFYRVFMCYNWVPPMMVPIDLREFRGFYLQMSNRMRYIQFKEIDLQNSFFDSLRNDYSGFDNWFIRKNNEYAWVIDDGRDILAFLYLKVEKSVGYVRGLDNNCEYIKIGTLKVIPHRTKLGERFIKKAIDFAISNSIYRIYVSVFKKHTDLVNLFTKYGFELKDDAYGASGSELLLEKIIGNHSGDSIKDYPLVNIKGNQKYMLAIYPKFHTKLFPDSILKNEDNSIVTDVSHTNSIHKVYICLMDVSSINTGDCLIIYRTNDGEGPAFFRSVATSLCIVESVAEKASFLSENDFISYCRPHSVFSDVELKDWYRKTCPVYILKFTYNVAFTKRVNRKDLIEKCGVDEGIRWSCIELSDDVFRKIIEAGEIDDNIIVN